MVRTTKSQRHREAILNNLAGRDTLEEDKYGNFLNSDKTLRYKPKKTALRIERKVGSRWVAVKVVYFKDISITDEDKFNFEKLIKG